MTRCGVFLGLLVKEAFKPDGDSRDARIAEPGLSKRKDAGTRCKRVRRPSVGSCRVG
jgi:hypothetical protein